MTDCHLKPNNSFSLVNNKSNYAHWNNIKECNYIPVPIMYAKQFKLPQHSFKLQMTVYSLEKNSILFKLECKSEALLCVKM